MTFTEPKYGRRNITLVSEKECEIRRGGEILLGEYSRHDDKLRVVVKSFGGTRVMYFEIVDEGLHGTDGENYLLPGPLAQYRGRVRLAQEAKKNRLIEERARIEQERQDRARRLLVSKTSTKVLAGYSCPMTFAQSTPKVQEITLTDVDVTFTNHYGGKATKAWYGCIRRVYADSRHYIIVDFSYRAPEVGYSSSMLVPYAKERREEIVGAIMRAIAAWRTRFPEQASHPGG